MYNPEHQLECRYSYFEHEWTKDEGMYYMTQKSYRSKTFTDFTHSMSEIISGMCNNGIVITGLQEFDYDISGGFENISKQGFPLSVIIEGKRGSAYIKCKERNTVYEQNIQCTGQTGSI